MGLTQDTLSKAQASGIDKYSRALNKDQGKTMPVTSLIEEVKKRPKAFHVIAIAAAVLILVNFVMAVIMFGSIRDYRDRLANTNKNFRVLWDGQKALADKSRALTVELQSLSNELKEIGPAVKESALSNQGLKEQLAAQTIEVERALRNSLASVKDIARLKAQLSEFVQLAQSRDYLENASNK